MTIEYQIYDFLEDHEVNEEEDSDEELDSSESPSEKKSRKFIIHSFGRTLEGKSVYAKIINYTPYFLIKLPVAWSKKECKDNLKKLKTWLLSSDNRKVWDKFKSGLKDINLIQKKSAEGFTNDRNFYFGRLIFDNSYAMRKFRLLFEENYLYIPEIKFKKLRFQTFEANLPPMLRCFHIKKITGCSWINVEKYKQITKEEDKASFCDIEINVDWRDLNYIQKDKNAPFRIASFDIECYSHDGKFPQARRKPDKIIQIGTTYTHVGESIPYRQHIACLGETNNINGIVVEWFNNEKDVIEAWRNEIIKSDCDILTGYNIFYFDEKYIYDRAMEHLYDINSDEKININYLSKLKERKCRFKEIKLASSALGENKLRWWDTPGRVHIDLMKDVQKTYKLSSYKLDSVSSNFIRGKVNKVTKIKNKNNKVIYTLECETIDDIFLEDYIHLELVKDFVSDYIGHKYIVTKLDNENKILTIESNEEIDLNLGEGKIFWSQAKDDVTPKDIFNLWGSGDPDKRAIVAKYCVKDCRLVNLLVNKLEVVTKNIEMANVCYVPFSYLFVRGQGIKLFSFCLKEYKDAGYVFPVIKRKITFNYEDGTSKSGKYQGLTLRSPYAQDDDDDLTDAEKKKKKGYNYEYIIEVKKKNDKKFKPKFKKSNLIKFNKFKMEIIKMDGYEGAIVFDPVPEVLYEGLATKDYSSLYPSSIIHKNMSHETLVMDEDYDDVEGVHYYNAYFRENDGSIKWRRFAQRGNELGVVPNTLSKILKERKRVKKAMKVEKNPFKYKILDAKQLALKVTANSLYGQLGAGTSPICMRDIAACTTSTGREMLIFAKKYDEEILPWIMNGIKEGYLKNKPEKIQSILDLEMKNKDNQKLKDQIKKFSTESTLDIVFQPIIRYGDTDSIFTCYRFKENYYKVKKDKSLILWKKIIKFSKLLIKPFIPVEYTYLWDRLHDKFYGDDKIVKLELPESPEVLPQPLHHKILLPEEERFKQFLKEYMEESYLPWLWTLQDIFSRTFNTEDIKNDIIQVKLYNMGISQVEKLRLTPDDISPENRYELDKLIYEFVKNTLKDNIIYNYWDISKNKIKRKVKFYEGGNPITDKRTLLLSMDIGIISGELVKSRLPFPHDLEYEKTYWPFLILTKKRYVGNKYEFNPDKYKQDCMGIVLKRRDNAPIVKQVCGGIINCLINERNPENARRFTKKCLDNMFAGKYNIKYFLTSKTLKSKESYKEWSRIAHVVLAERIGIRDPGNKPQSGDRIEYAAVEIENQTKNTLQGDRIETPLFIKQNNLQLDYKFYMTNQIMKPALQFLQLVVPDAKLMFDELIIKCENKKLGRTDIHLFLKKSKKCKKKNKDKKLKN
jgi:DNA polymerase elongation subunit (family B)